MPPAYTSQQKAAIAQFMNFTSVDRTAAARVLKNHNWDAQAAVNTYFSGGGGSAGSPAIKTILTKVFDHYRENPSAEPDMVGAEGTMQYCSDTKVDLEGLDSLVVHEIVQAPAMAEMRREGFVSGWQERNCETVEKQKAYIKNIKAELPGNRELFERIYKYAFTIAKTANSRQAALEQAIEFWKLLFGSPLSPIKWKSANTPWLDWWEEFLTTSFKKSINKDMWNETLKFAKLTLADDAMTFWTEESSWPSVIDDFVEWVKTEKRGGGKTVAMDEDY
ncbi:Cullin binding-domain-containing protein [Ampelomyces quisqualis]|uniref:Defective in cullin neddylation protein n=1 Tax=Ampelomyces quisqualis TaxID=50730 RepID=A0A6A5R2G0_AMPQU|nr:Cullin binding-domain-containing protein [Ampelomyces quisqualis]